MAPTKRFCSRGHDTWQVGRNNSRECRECKRIRERERTPERRDKVAAYTRTWRERNPNADWTYYITTRRWRNLETQRANVAEKLAALEELERRLRK